MSVVRERNPVTRRGIFRPRSLVLDGDTGDCSGSSPAQGFFTQQHADAKVFMEEHFQVKISPFPSCHQIARKDRLWQHFKVSVGVGSEYLFFHNFLPENAAKIRP